MKKSCYYYYDYYSIMIIISVACLGPGKVRHCLYRDALSRCLIEFVDAKVPCTCAVYVHSTALEGVIIPRFCERPSAQPLSPAI